MALFLGPNNGPKNGSADPSFWSMKWFQNWVRQRGAKTKKNQGRACAFCVSRFGRAEQLQSSVPDTLAGNRPWGTRFW